MSPLCLLILALSLQPPIVVQSQQSTLQLRRETFEIVWRRVKEKHYDPNLNGVDWDAVHEAYSPRVAAVETDDEFYHLLNQMLGELNQSHFAVIPPSVYLDEEGGAGRSSEAEVGMTVQLVEDRPTITRVEPDSPAARAGLRPGYILVRVDGKAVNEIQEKLVARHERPTRERFLLRRVVLGRLRGPVGSTVSVCYLDENDKPHTTKLKRRAPKGQRVKFGELPTLYAAVQAKRLPEGVGYLRFNIFMVPLVEQIRRAVRSFHDAPGMIIDLRGNPGGISGMALSVARLFYGRRVLLGTTKMRRGEIRFTVFPTQDPYTGPVAILTDEGTGSTSEILAGGMQENGRAIIVGQPSVGAVLPSVIERLPIGARLQYAFADFRTPHGILLEGRGVLPDVPVEIRRRELLAGRDPVLEHAVSALLKQRAHSGASKVARRAQ